MEMKRVLAGWNKVCPGCNIARKYPNSFIGKRVRAHWESGCAAHNAYVEVYGADEPTSKKAAAKKAAPKKDSPEQAKASGKNPGGSRSRKRKKKAEKR